MAGYITAPFGRVHPSPMMWQMEYGIMAQRYRGVARNLSQKWRSWYLAMYRRANPKKEGVDIWRSTDEQTPKRKELIFGEVQTSKPPQKGRSWYLRSTDGQTPKRKELIFGEVQTGKTPKRKESIFREVQTGKSHNGKSWSLTKVQTDKSQNGKSWSLTKVQTNKSQNGKSWSLTKAQTDNLSQ